jgi:hypothetical protein
LRRLKRADLPGFARIGAPMEYQRGINRNTGRSTDRVVGQDIGRQVAPITRFAFDHAARMRHNACSAFILMLSAAPAASPDSQTARKLAACSRSGSQWSAVAM